MSHREGADRLRSPVVARVVGGRRELAVLAVRCASTASRPRSSATRLGSSSPSSVEPHPRRDRGHPPHPRTGSPLGRPRGDGSRRGGDPLHETALGKMEVALVLVEALSQERGAARRHRGPGAVRGVLV